MTETLTAETIEAKPVNPGCIKKGQKLRKLPQQRRDSILKSVTSIAQNLVRLNSKPENEHSIKARAALEMLASDQAVTLASNKTVDWPIIKTAIEACDKLFGWSKQDQPTTLVQVGYLRELEAVTPQENLREIKDLSEKPQELLTIPQAVDSITDTKV